MKQQAFFLTTFCLLAISAIAGSGNNESNLGKTDFQALISAIPAMPSTTDGAYQLAYNRQLNANSNQIMEERFVSFNQKMDLFEQQFSSPYQSKMNKYFQTKGEDGLYRDAKKQANSNTIVQSMGGVDKVQQMSEADSREAEKNAAVQRAASSSFGLISEEDMKRMMSDPEYAKAMSAKFANMTEQQKAALVQQQVTANPVTFESDEDAAKFHQNYEKQLKETQSVKNAMLITQFVSGLQQRISAALAKYDSQMKKMRTSSGNHAELDKLYAVEFSKIPLVEMGEGMTEDPEQVRALKCKYAQLHRERAGIELAAAETNYKGLLATIRQTHGEYLSFLDENGYRVNGEMSDLMNGTNTEIALAQAEMSIGESITQAAKICYEETSTAAGYEHDFYSTTTER